MSILAEKLVETLSRSLPAKASLHEPWFKGNEWNYVKECIDTAWVSSVGKYVDTFEEKLAEYTGSKKAIVIVNGTAALQTCLNLVGVTSGDEVLVPSLTFVATANAVAYQRATPHFYDCDDRYLGVEVAKLREYLHENTEIRGGVCFNKKTDRPIRAMIVMHTYGHPVDLDAVLELCNEFNLPLIEDAAESLGSFYKDRHTGNFGKVAALSFNGNKIITTGGGGAIVTNDIEMAKEAKHLTTTAKVPHQWEYNHDKIGFNFRLPNLNSALGVAQLEQLPEFLQKKRAIAKHYQTLFADMPEVEFFAEPEFARSNYWLNAIFLREDQFDNRDEVLARLNEAGYMVRPLWIPMHKLDFYKNCPAMNLENCEQAEKKVISLPSSPFLLDQ